MKKSILLTLLLLPSLVLATFDQDLRYGSRGTQVTALQQFLVTDGCLAVNPTGNFLSKTKDAVKCFQAKHALPTTGFFGPLTRKVINTMITNVAVTPVSPPPTPTTTATPPTPIASSTPVAGNACTGKTKGDSCSFGETGGVGICDNALNGHLLFCVPVR